MSQASLPGHRAEGITENFSPIDIDVTAWTATLKRSHTTNSRSLAHSRDPSSNQSFFAGLKAAFSESSSQPANLSPRLYTGSTRGGSIDADAKSHHRNTSIVNGIQRSRNGSFGSSSTSPLSPQIIAAAGEDWADASVMGDSNFSSSASSMTSGTSFSSNTTFVPSRSPSAAENAPSSSTQRNMERGNSNGGRSRRNHSHHHSHSRHHKDELKTVGEYALHVLFTSVSSPWST